MSQSLSRAQSGASADATSVTISSTAVYDLILVSAYNKTNATIPSLPAGFTNILSVATANGAMRVGYKISTGAETTSGTWTNATSVVCLVYKATSDIVRPSIGVSVSHSGSGTTLTYKGLNSTNGVGTLRTDGYSWAVGFGGARSATAGMNGNTTGGSNNLTNQTNRTTHNGLDSTAGIASFGTDETLTVTTTGEWATATVEVFESGGEIPENAVQSTSMIYRGFFFAGGGGGAGSPMRRVNVPGVPYDLIGGPGRMRKMATYETAADGAMDSGNFGAGEPGERDDTGATSGPPCQLQSQRGRILEGVPLGAGSHTIQISCRFWPDSGAGKRPRLVAKMNYDIGLHADETQEAVAPTPGAFQIITLSLTTTRDGVLELYREMQDDRMDAWVMWDDLLVA